MEKYIKVRKIGEGSFGVAFLARTKENGKQVVLKEINMNKMTLKESNEARREVSVLAQLKHSNIVSYLESFELSGNLYIVMDFCDGGDLFGRITAQHGTPFPEEQILDWFVQMCLAVKHIHDRKILHRDIKSQNIFLTKHGIVKLGDFGIAKVLNSTVELSRTCIGTPYYLSPEICEARPYNNKSDIWSLGCVLYELTTLKHAFEAPSMKALVLNIVRGIYPPPSSKYSVELRNLIALLFKKNARDRPSVNTILKKPLLQAKIRKFLSELEIAEEFSHTVMHGMKIQKAIQAPQPRPLPPRPSSAAGRQPPPPSPSAPRYNPASVYGPSVACRKSKENLCKENKAPNKSQPAYSQALSQSKIVSQEGPCSVPSRDPRVRKSSEVRKSVGQDRPIVRRPNGSGNSRPPSAGPVQDIAKRRQEFIEKEKERREEVRKKQEQEYARQHRELMEKQKLARMNRNRDDGWRNVLNSSNSEEKEAGAGANAIVVRKIGNYDQHLAQLRKLEERSQEPISSSQPSTPKPAECVPVQAENVGLQAGNEGAVVAEKARIYEEFIQRKEAAALNRARAQGGVVLPLNPIPSPAKPAWAMSPSPNSPNPGPSGDRMPVARVDDDKKREELLGGKPAWVAPPVSDQISSSPGDRPSSARIRDEERRKQAEEYMAKLRQIRLQNFNERCLREKNAAQNRSPSNLFQSPESLNNEARLKKKKIEALRAQAEARAKILKEDLEERRNHAVEEKQRLQEPQVVVRPVGLLPNKVDPTRPSVGLTAAIAAIGAAVPERVEPTADQDKSSIKKTKQEILKRINSNISKPNTPQRGKWAEAGVTNILGQMDLETKGKWTDAGVTNVLGELDLEENHPPSEIESKAPDVKELDEVRDASGQEGRSASTPTPRRQWPAQRGTVVDILSSVAICEATRGATIAIKSSEVGANSSVGEPCEISNVNKVVGAEVGGESNQTVCNGKETTIIETKDVEEENANDLEGKKELFEPSKQEEPPVVDGSGHESDSSSEDRVEDGETIPVKVKMEDANLDSPSVEVEKSSDEDRLEVGDLEGPDALDEEEDKKLFQPGKGLSLKQGLTTGHFDAVDVKLLRTCSEPDLHKLSLSKQPREQNKIKLPVKSSGDVRDEEGLGDLEVTERQAVVDDNQTEEEESGMEFSVNDLDTEEPDETITTDDVGLEGTVSESLLVASEEDDDVGEESDDSDLRTLRESMANILASKDHESSGEEILMNTATKSKKKTKKGKCGKKGKKKKTKESSNEESKPLAKVWSDTSLDDFQSMKETMKSLLQPTKPSGGNIVKPKSTLTLSVIAESSYVCEVTDSQQDENMATLVPSFDSSDSDIDRTDDDYFEDDGIFAHLEGIRASLEDKLGCETFLRAYATVQSFQEEDEDMEEGIRTVTRILGPDNVYLYPSILQLVMADAAFSDNG